MTQLQSFIQNSNTKTSCTDFISYFSNLPLALDAPYYVADNTTASIRAGQVTAVTLQCKVGNSMASFAFADPDAAATLLSQYTIESRVGSTTVSCTVDDGHNPYFSAGSTVDFYLKGSTAAGKAVDYKFASIANAQRQKNYKYTLQLGGVQEGGAILGITVSTVVESISLSDVIPQEWLPKAKITAAGFDETGHLDYYETEQVTLSSKSGSVRHTFDHRYQLINITARASQRTKRLSHIDKAVARFIREPHKLIEVLVNLVD